MNPQAQEDWDLAASLQAQLSHLTLNKPYQAPEEDYLKIIAYLKEQVRKAEKRLAKASPLANIEFKQRRATAKAVAEKLPANGALVEYVKINDYDFDNSRLGEKRYIAFVLKQNGEVKLLDLGLADSLDRQVILTLGHIKGSRADALQAGAATASSIGQSFESLRNLYQKLWAPLEGALAGVNTVFISPDGLVNHVPFAASKAITPLVSLACMT